MDKSQIAILLAVLAIVAFRMYKKYGNKDNTGTVVKPKEKSFSSGEDDYEPYSKK